VSQGAEESAGSSVRLPKGSYTLLHAGILKIQFHGNKSSEGNGILVQLKGRVVDAFLHSITMVLHC
jgi:hypothetical protein